MNITKDYISKQNTYTGQNHPKYIVIHETDNWARGAGAQRHASAQAAGHLNISVHYYCGSDGIYQAAEHTDGTYSVGREYGGGHAVTDATNRNTINIEICVNEDGDYPTARANAIALVKYLIQTTGIPADRVIRHHDAKGKYCPRRMMDEPALWKDFKAQIRQPDQSNPVPPQEPDCETPNQPDQSIPGPSQEPESWYRVGTGWSNGICQNQTGAYHNLDFAIADCAPGQKVYDENGNVLHAADKAPQQSSGQNTQTSAAHTGYTQQQFIRDVQAATGSRVDGCAGDETLRNTVTVSRTKNRHHPVVTPLERRLKALGYYTGVIEADEGRSPSFGPGMETAVNAYQRKVNNKKNPDGEITAGQRMWKSLLGMI